MSTTATAPAPTDTPTPTAADVVGNLPEITPESFIDSVDAAFAGFNDEPAPEVTPEKKVDEPAKKVDEQAKKVDEPAKKVDEPKPDDVDPMADLNEIEDNTKDWTPEAARRFKELKTELKAVKTRAQELEQLATQREARVKELDAVAADPEIATLKKQVEEQEKELMFTRLEKSTTYKKVIQEPLDAIVDQMGAIATKYSVNTEAVIDAAFIADETAQDEKLSELLVDVSDRDRSRIYHLIEGVKPLIARRTELQENAKAALLEAQELETQESSLKLAETAKQRSEAAVAVAERLQSKVPFLTGLDGVDMATIQQEAAAVDPSTLDPVSAVYQSISAKLLPKLAAAYIGLQKEFSGLTDKLAEYDSAKPNTSGSPNGTPSAAKKIDDNVPFEVAIERQLSGGA